MKLSPRNLKRSMKEYCKDLNLYFLTLVEILDSNVYADKICQFNSSTYSEHTDYTAIF